MLTHYFLSVHLLLAAGYLLYKLMGRDTFFTVRRLFLLGITLFALTAEPLAPQRAVVSWDVPIQLTQTIAEPLFLSSTVNSSRAFDLGTMFWTAYGCITVLLLLRLLFRLHRYSQRVRRSILRQWNGIDYRILEGSGAFSFFRYIFIGKEQELSPQLPYILLHERAHAKGLHSLDVVWMQLIEALFWINPFVSLITRELRIVHEYLADRAVRSVTTDVKGYQLALLHQTTSSSAATLLNNFNVSSLKRRIFMLNQKPTSRKWSVKFLALLPAALTTMVCFSWAKASTLTSNAEILSAIRTELCDSLQTEQSPDQRAVYPGGDAALMQEVAKNVRFPKKAVENKTSGRCIVTFTIDADGKVTNPRIYKSLTPECDKEVLRVVSRLKKFQPAMKDGKPVSMQYTIPISFRYR